MMKLFLAACAFLLLLSCSATPRDPYAGSPGAPVWPPPPEAPRVQYVSSIHSHEDLFRTGNFLTSVLRFAVGEDDHGMVRPHAIALYPGGGLLVTDPGRGQVHFYDTERRKYRAIGAGISGGLPSPMGVAAMRDGSILVSDSRRGALERFDRDGRYLGRFAPDYEFRRPAGVAVHPETGEVHVLDVLAHELLAFSEDGELLRVSGGNGAGPGMFNFPTHLAFDSQSNLMISDSMNFRIQRLASDGTPIDAYGEPGNARGDFARPKGVASLADGIHVAIEGLYDSLLFFNSEGDLLLGIGGAGSGPGEFWLPAGLAADRERGLLFVADSYNARVQVFRMIPSAGSPDSPHPGGGP